jgi:hypothetical protein
MNHAHGAANSGGTVCANVLAGTTLKSTVVTSSLETVGTLSALTVDDVAINGKVVTMTGSACDTIVMTAAANGAFSLVTTDTAAAAANIVITADGTVDVNSAGLLTLDSGAAINIEPAACSAILLDGTISIDAGVVTGATSITSTAFVGTIDGVLGGNTPAAITGTTLTVDNFTLNGTELDLSTGNFTLDVAGDIEINADGGCINFKDASLALAAIVNTSCVGELRIHEAANFVGFKAPALTGDTTYTLPAAYAACTGMALTSTDAGVMSWAAAGGIAASHGGVVKGYARLAGDGALQSGCGEFNVSAACKQSTGFFRVTWDTDFGDALYSSSAVVEQASAMGNVQVRAIATTHLDVQIFDACGSAGDAAIQVIAIGDQ